MKKKILFGLILFLTLQSYATHSLGGYLSYKHISGFTYEVTVSIIQDRSSPAIARDKIELNWGDGSFDSLQVISQTQVGEPDSYLLIRIWKGTHTYLGAGSFDISVTDPNRTANIVNISNSLNIPLYFKTKLIITPTQLSNSSPLITSLLPSNASDNGTYTLNLAATESDGDFLFYKLITTKGQNGNAIPGYSIPSNTSIDMISGELKWEDPRSPGLYSFTVEITECRNDELISTTSVDLLIRVASTTSNIGFLGLDSLTQDSAGRFVHYMEPGDTFQFSPSFYDSTLISFDQKLVLFADTSPSNYLFNTVDGNPNTSTFSYTPMPSELRCAPRLFVFRGTSLFDSKDLSLLIHVRDSTLTGCDTLCGYRTISIAENKIHELKTTVYPNPFNLKTRIHIDSEFTFKKLEFSLYDMHGRLVKSESIQNSNKVIVNRANLKKGQYIYRLITEKGGIARGKLLLID